MNEFECIWMDKQVACKQRQWDKWNINNFFNLSFAIKIVRVHGQSDFLLKNNNTMHWLKGIELHATETVTHVCTYLQFLLWFCGRDRERDIDRTSWLSIII